MRQLKNLLLNINRTFKRSTNIDENQNTFYAICDVLYYSIKNEDLKVVQEITDFLYEDFDRIRLQFKNKPVVFPIHHYQLTNKLTQLLANNTNKSFRYLKDRTVGSLWLLGERTGFTISKETFSCIWMNLKTAVEYDDQDMIIDFWKNAHQHISYRLDYIYPNYVLNDMPKMTNQKEYDERIKQRKRFLQFTVALGGLLMYTKQYNTIQRCFKYTQSTPPKYELLPERMDEVFEHCIHFYDPYSENYPFMGFYYSFPKVEGLNEDGIIKKFICKYIALLFLRQYSLVPYLSYMEPLRLPNIPNEPREIKKWLENVDYFKLLIEEVYNDKQLLAEVGFGWLTDEWIIEKQKIHPLLFIENFKSELEKRLGLIEETQNISETKKENFLRETKKILEGVFKEYSQLSNENNLSGDVEKRYIYGGTALFSKNAFADNQGESYLNADTILAGSIANNFKEAISNSFLIHRSAYYLFSAKEVFQAIDMLNIDNNYILIAFRLNFHDLIDELKIEGLTKNSYKGIDIKHFDYVNYKALGNTIFVIKKDDLPRFEYLETNNAEKDKYELKQPISEEYKLYANIIDLNIHEDLRNLIEANNEGDLSKKVLAYIGFNFELQWKKNVDCISLRIYSEYLNRGIPNNLSDLQPLKNRKNDNDAS